MAEKAAATVPAVSVGETVSGTVEHVAPYGAFVRLESGQKVTAKVIKIDDKGRIDLSIKALQAREVRQPAHREEDFEKKLTNFLKFSVEKMADLNSKNKAQRSGTKRRTGGQQGKK